MPGQSQERLPEERQFRGVLIGCCLAVALFVCAAIIATLYKSATRPSDVTAGWFSAWGGWGGGLAAASAFLIAAYSLRVTSAHARADRLEAARVQQSQDMAQARLLVIYEVEMTNVPPNFRFYRIDNRSKDLFFDVKVPYIERYDMHEKLRQTTPESSRNTLETLPEGVLLTPYRTHSQDEGWFTEVRVYATPDKPVHFAVSYTDAAGLQWKQHLDGHIERVLSTQAVSGPRKADTIQPYSQVRMVTMQEAEDVVAGRFFGDVPAEVEEAGMEDVAADIVESWARARRIGQPHPDPVRGQPELVNLEIAYSPDGPHPWGDYFTDKLAENGFPGLHFFRPGVGDAAAIELQTPANDIERTIGIVDEALDFANDEFERVDLPQARARVERIAAQQTDLEELVKPFARPGVVPWRVPDVAGEVSPFSQHGNAGPSPDSRGPSDS